MLLGPDGKPIETGPPVSNEVKEIVERAKAIAAEGAANPELAGQSIAQALQQMVFAFQTDVTSNLVLDTTCDFLRQMMQMQGATESDELQLFLAYREDRKNPILAFQIGNRFAQLGQTFLARPFLIRARTLLDDPTTPAVPGLPAEQKPQLAQAVDTDLAQVYLDLGAYQEAIENFHRINDLYGGLHIGLVLMMAEAYSLLRQIDEAEQVYQIASPESAAQFEGMEEWREEVGDLMARVRDFDDQEDLGLRAWHYIQTRGMLLETNPDENIPGERWVFFQPSEEDVAYIISLTAAILDHKGYAPNRIVWLGESSETLARLFAQWWEVDAENVRPYQKGDSTDDESQMTLLVMAHSYDIFALNDEDAFADLMQARAGLITFALDVRWTERQPMTPDIAGFMTQACNMPFENRMQVNEDGQTMTPVVETRDPQTMAESIAKFFPTHEESDEFARETLEEYSICTDLLLDHRDGTLFRRPLGTHSPIKSPRIGF